VSRLLVLLAALAAVALLLAAPAAQAAPAPFGHGCTARDGVRFCPTSDLSQRVRSWDGVPLDVDVTLPRTGAGPFPTILLLHGLSQTKTAFESAGGEYTNVGFARRGYAVVTPTARGFGNSCGRLASRTAGCERGWARLADMRYEVRDLQWLVGRLVDEGIARRDRIGSTGISYGGGMSTMLAYLHDRVRLPSGRLAPWRSPEGRRISLTAAWPRWLWTNGGSIFTRNGRGYWSRSPFGVVTKHWADLIFLAASTGFVAPSGGDLSADLRMWKRLLDTSATGPTAARVLENSYLEHGVASLPGRPAPLLLQSGWTDALFPVGQALAAYDRLLRRDPSAPVALQLGDLGHGGANHPDDDRRFTRQGAAFFDAWLKGRGSAPRPGAVTAFTQVCPKTARAGGGPYTGRSFDALSPGRLSFGTSARLRVTSRGADPALAGKLGGVGGDCTALPPDPTSKAVFSAVSPGVTLLGLPTLTGTVRTTGRNGQLDVRLWDLDPATRTQRMITRGTYRLVTDQSGAFRLELDGNGWRFPAGHRIVVELLGRDAPTYGASPTSFSARLDDLRISLPVRERVAAPAG
jgi:hypothetical protein